MRLLLTWSDRIAMPEARKPRSTRDTGPILRLLEQPESRGAYDVAWVLTTPPHRRATEELVKEIRRHVRTIEVHCLDVEDPSDHAQLFEALRPLVATVPETAYVTTVLSAGTPQAQTLWVLLIRSGILTAADVRMVQVIPPAFVPHPHPRAIRDVDLDIPGFPEIRALREEVVQLRAREVARSGIVGSSAAIEEMHRRIARVATARVPVLVFGETGTGKDLVARAIHRASPRAKGPFLAENCGAFSEGTLASELFGHEKGAFTGASERRMGLFELAHGGTLFLDELGEMGERVQVGLLRVLEDGTLRRVGGEREIHVDVRIVGATHRDLGAMVRAGRFREDLYYRLKGAVIEVPSLRDRIADLEALIVHFQSESGDRGPQPTRAAFRALQRYGWPGNVRELRAEVARWSVFFDDRVETEDLSPEIRTEVAPGAAKDRAHVPARPPRTLPQQVRELESQVIRESLERNRHNLVRTARELGIDRNTLKRKLDGHGLARTAELPRTRARRSTTSDGK